jgi:hypothetical protein
MKTCQLLSILVVSLLAGCNKKHAPIQFESLDGKSCADSRASCYELGLVSQEAFSSDELVPFLRRFHESKSSSHAICQLILVHDVDALDGSRWAPSGIDTTRQDYVNPGTKNGSWDRGSDLATVFTLKEAAVAVIKTGAVVKTIQLSGDHDPRIIDVGTSRASIVTFLSLWSDPKNLQVLAVTKPLPSPEDATRLYEKLLSAVRVEHLYMEFREDGNFQAEFGPYLDVFSPPFRDTPAETYYSSRHVSCGPGIRSLARSPSADCKELETGPLKTGSQVLLESIRELQGKTGKP